jgi:predicted ATPase
MPATVQAILAARIDRLDPEAKRLLQAAAVIGKDVPIPLLLAIADATESEVRAELTRLQAAEFLYEVRLFPDLEYTFKHALTHEVAYQGLLHDRQRALHARITEAIERLSSERIAEQAERLAHHALDDAQWKMLDPRQRRRRTLDALRQVLLREAREQPLLLIFEDLHWIDGETQALLDSLVESLPAARLLLLVNYRPEYNHAWGSKTYYRQLRIDPLAPEGAEELLDALLGPDANLGPLKRLLIERTEANPLFLEESVRALAETGALTGKTGAYRLTQSIAQLKMAPTIQAILAARIDRLAPEGKRLLQAAAVIGKDVPLPLLLAIADVPEHEVRPTWSTRSSTRSRTRWPTRGCSRTGGARYTPGSLRPSSGSRASALLSRRSGWPITPCVGSVGTRLPPISGRPVPRRKPGRRFRTRWRGLNRRSPPSGSCRRVSLPSSRPSRPASSCGEC